jgi:hypothetical protein
MILLTLTFNINKIREDNMKKSLAKRALVLATLIAVVFMFSIAYAEDTSKTKPVADQGATLNQLENAVDKKMECTNAPEPKGFTPEAASVITDNNGVHNPIIIAGSSTKGRDGAACYSGSECKSGVCEGGSCCTAHGSSCDSNSHCCGHQSCSNGTCP